MQTEEMLHEDFSKKVLKVLGIELLDELSEQQEISLDNQLQDLLEENNNQVDKVTPESIKGRYKLVTEHLYPKDFVETSNRLQGQTQNNWGLTAFWPNVKCQNQTWLG